MLGYAASHGWCLFLLSRGSCRVSLAQFLVGTTEIVDRADQVHPCFQRVQLMGGMTTFAGQGSKPLPHRSVEPFNEGSVEDRPSP